MLPYDKIINRSNSGFPFDEFLRYSRTVVVDWREEERSVVEGFLNAVGLPNGDVTLDWDQAASKWTLIHRNLRYPIECGDGISAQHATLIVLQSVYGASHSIRYLNHVAPGDTAYCVVESPGTWRELESKNPHVAWFFTPLELLPDLFNAPFENLAATGSRYSNGQSVGSEPDVGMLTQPAMRDFIDACRARFRDAQIKSGDSISFVDRLRPPQLLAQTPNHPLLTIYGEQPTLFKQGRIVWSHVVQANKKLFELGEDDLPAALVFSIDPYFDARPAALAEIASHLYAQKDVSDPDPAVAEFARIITSESDIAFNLRIPKQCVADREVFYTTAMVQRSHLPKWILQGPLVPLLVAPKVTHASMIVPHKYWPSPLWP